MISYQILIGGVDYTEYCTLPFKEQYVLDSALDNAVLTLTMTPQNKVFKPFTLVTITRQGDTYNMYVASDNMTEIIGTGLYNHELTLIEETKLLEKKVVDTNTTTQPNPHNYNSLSLRAKCVYREKQGSDYNVFYGYAPITYRAIYDLRIITTVNIIGLDVWFEGFYRIGTIDIYRKLYDEEELVYHEQTDRSQGQDSPGTIINLQEGNYRIEYKAYHNSIDDAPDNWDTVTFKAVPSDAGYKKTITNVVNRLLAITDTLRESETPRLKFNDEQARFYDIEQYIYTINNNPTLPQTTISESINFVSNNIEWTSITIEPTYIRYSKVSGGVLLYIDVYSNGQWNNDYKTFETSQHITGDLLDWLTNNATSKYKPPYYAPEFSMTKSTLRECLDQIGGYIHSIVRLKGNEIYFDKLGGDTQSTFDTDYIGHYETLDCEQYASQLDSIVSNMTNIDDETTGTMTEPFANNYKTVRAESGTLRIGDGQNNTTAIIETDYPIEKIAKVICSSATYYDNGVQTINVGDITSYVYESADYDLLSSNSAEIGNSKGFALKYTQGQKNITGLTFKLPNILGSQFSNQAILNIISSKIHTNIQTLFYVQNITELSFQVIYYPSTTARVKQSRTDITNYSMELTSIYNQSANKVDSRAYGENLKAVIMRLGNIDKVITYYFSSLNEVAPVGSYITIDNEDYYVATVGIENQMDYLKATLGLSKDFNALSKYIGIKNNIRMYEVSEKQAVERYVTYEDYCVITNKNRPVAHDGLELMTSNAKESIINQFVSTENVTMQPTSVAVLQGTSKLDELLNKVNIPVFSLALGNSVWLGCKYEDNYSAGTQSVTGNDETAGTPTKDSSKFYRLNQYVPYGDYYGEIETLSVNMYSTIGTPADKTQTINVGNTVPGDVSSILGTPSNPLISTDNNPLVIKKDNREQINFSYQLHFVTNDGIIIGTQLAQGNILCSTVGNNYAKLYILPNRINKFADKIDLSNATLVHSYQGDSVNITYDSTNEEIVFEDETANANGKSWVLVDAQNERLLFGKNIAIANGDTIEMPKMSFTHKII